MVVSCWPEFGKPYAPRRFIIRRLVRIVPLYWLATLFYDAVVVCCGKNVDSRTRERLQFIVQKWSSFLSSECLEVIVFLSLCYQVAGAIGGVDAQL